MPHHLTPGVDKENLHGMASCADECYLKRLSQSLPIYSQLINCIYINHEPIYINLKRINDKRYFH